MNEWISVNTVQPSLWTLFLFMDVHFHIFLSFSFIFTSPLAVDGDMSVWKERVWMDEECGGNEKEEKRKRKNERTMGRE